mgnify:CR=1 FL=1
MYHIDIPRIERQLDYLQTCLEVLEEVRSLSRVSEQFAAARALHVAIECVTDIGNALIDGFIMRDPGSYEDIVEIMKDEGVLPVEEAEQVKQLVEYRRALVVRYTEVGKAELARLISLTEALNPFAQRIEDYLQQELGENAPKVN